MACACLALAPAVACRGNGQPAPLVADVSGRREVAGLSAPVRVVRDRYGVPHIYAENPDDLFFAQGFVAAQDRLFQMDVWRRWALGRLSEVLGPNFAERDAMTRRIQYAGSVDGEWASYAPDTRAIASAFVRGVNAWVALARERPPEEFVLAGWLPETWSANDLLNRTDAFAASGDGIDEIFRARLVAAVGAPRAADLLAATVVVPPGLDPAVAGSAVADAIRSVGAPPFFLGLAAPPQTGPRPDASDADARRGDISLEVRALPLPSPRYLIHLHAPGWNVIGATAPWLPGVSEGHNDRVAWRMEAVDVDSEDVFVERVNPANPHQVEERGQWVDTRLTKDSLAIRRRDKPVVFDRERTSHGAILAVDRERHIAFTVRWAGDGPGGAGDLLALEIDRAAGAADVRAALDRWTIPARRVDYADVEGHSGSEIAARVPVRRGWSGALPAPGWTGANDWIGWRRPDAADRDSPLRLLARRRPERADALLHDLQRAAGQPDAPQTMRAILVNATADALRDGGGPNSAVLFTHPLAITEATRRRFNVGPIRPGAAAPVFGLTGEVANWDRSTAMNAPGQSGSPASIHYADLVRAWRAGQTIPLAFSDDAVNEAAESTLTLAPLPGSSSR